MAGALLTGALTWISALSTPTTRATVDPEDDYGYPSLTLLRDSRTALVLFHARDGLHLARIDVDWFYAE